MDAQLSRLLEFLRFPSISTDSAYAIDVKRCAEWLTAQLREIGLAVELHTTPGHPIVVAKNRHKPGLRNVLIYGHYDVQPVDPLSLWTHPPFEPHVENGVIFARGATDNKGQIMAHILGIQEALSHGELPVNLTVLVEGEEECGSTHLEDFLVAHREELACDIVAISDTGMVGRGIPTLTYGLRGIGALEIKITGPTTDLHSGIYGGAVANPLTMLSRLLATLHDPSGHVSVEGFYDDVAPLADWERKAWAALPLQEKDLLTLTGSPALFGEAGYTSFERTWARPTAEINGIGGGYQGLGTKTVLPSEAFAKLTFRLVPNQEPQAVLAKVKAHLEKHVSPAVRMEITGGHSGEPYVVDPHSAFGKAAQSALQKTFGRDVALIREGGSIPIVQNFKSVLNAETLLLGLALPDCRAHAPNENFPIENFMAGIRLNQALLAELGTVAV
jgi:acetylornithine deacetylase/succinyl-diaminopimelate desuccinylase-like protein